jgi:hypothetical protein
MRGNIATLTVGDYFKGQYGIINGFTFEMNSDSDTWEIDINENGGLDTSVAQLPHIVKVSGFSFTPIHNFVPRRYNGVENYINAIQPSPIPGGTINPNPNPSPNPAPPVIGGGGGSGAGTDLLILQSSANNSPAPSQFGGFGGGSFGGGGAGGGFGGGSSGGGGAGGGW